MTRVIIAGDLHLYYDDTNQDAVDRFKQLLLEDPPDVLVLGGDIYELWRRGLFSSGWSTYDFTDVVKEVSRGGTEVHYLVGNHDEYVLYHTSELTDTPLSPQKDLRLDVDGTQLFVTHGHKYEPVYNPITNDLLSYPDEWFGWLAGQVWEMRPTAGDFDPVGAVGSALLGPAASLPDPNAIRNQGFRKSTVRSGVAGESGDSWGIYGHTHTPFIDTDEKIVNWGSMTADQRGYVEVVGGDVSLNRI